MTVTGRGRVAVVDLAAVKRALRGAVGVVAFLALCQAVTMLLPVSEKYLPDTMSVLRAFFDLLGDSTFWSRLLETLAEWGAGIGIAIAFGIPTGVLLGASDLLYRMFRGPLELLRPIPGVALMPLFILVFGQTFQATMWLVAYASIWPILLNTIYGVHDVVATARETARSFGLGRTAILVRVYLPSALPLILTGVRVAAGIALIIAVAVELLIGTGAGIGAFISETTLAGQDTAIVYAAVVAAGLLGLAINVGLSGLEAGICPWRAAGGGRP
ncbi:ABC transporter permease [Streptomyces sp. NPDC096311]|uniref:ABC transporter permease n=1 Tax=Streptomyces sp. NPDC096311 TaxID=3366083 RepID=UPI00382F600D